MKISLYKVVKLLNKVKPTIIAFSGIKPAAPMDVPQKTKLQITFLTLLITLLFGLSFGNTVEITTAFPAPNTIMKPDVAIVKICQNVGFLPVELTKK